jgi:hypothetical protein
LQRDAHGWTADLQEGEERWRREREQESDERQQQRDALAAARRNFPQLRALA